MPSTTPRPLTAEQEARREELFTASVTWMLHTLGRQIPRDWRLLEVGAGRHGWAPLYQRYADEVVALDLIDYSLDNPGVEYVVTDFTGPIPLEPESFDMVVSHSVLEHVPDLDAALGNINLVLKTGRYAYLTVSPLYYSATGAHMKPQGVHQWEHLDPQRPFYLTDNPLPHDPDGGHHLNRMTWSDLLAAVGRQPWEILGTRLGVDRQPLPEWLEMLDYPEWDLRCRGFQILIRKVLG